MIIGVCFFVRLRLSERFQPRRGDIFTNSQLPKANSQKQNKNSVQPCGKKNVASAKSDSKNQTINSSTISISLP